MSKPVLLPIVCSTRPGRLGRTIGDWFAAAAAAEGTFDVRLVDLAEVALPLLDEPNHPAMLQYTKDHTKAWSRTVASADAVVWVQPEYNFGMCAAQKNAIDYLFTEWAHLPTGFVSYGGVSGGLRSVEHAKAPIVGVTAVCARNAVTIPGVFGMVNETGFTPTAAVAESVAPMLQELARLHHSLGEARRAALAPLGYDA